MSSVRLFIYSQSVAAWFGFVFFNGGLAKVKRKKQLPLAVKKQPPNSHTEAGIMGQGPRAEGFVAKGPLGGSPGLRERRDALCSQRVFPGKCPRPAGELYAEKEGAGKHTWGLGTRNGAGH